MSLPPKAWIHQEHGDSLHDLVIFLCERELVRRSGKDAEYTFLDKKWFADKFQSAAIPDVYYKKVETFITSRGQKKATEQKYVLEIESKPTSASIAKKREHFLETTTGHELIILNLQEVEDDTNWLELTAFVKERVP